MERTLNQKATKCEIGQDLSNSDPAIYEPAIENFIIHARSRFLTKLIYYRGWCAEPGCNMHFKGTLKQYKTVRLKAKNHARKTGHEVEWETSHHETFKEGTI